MNNKKQIILIGAGSYFTDSFLFFKERGFELICIKINNNVPWFDNYKLLHSIGFNIIQDCPGTSYLDKLELTANTLIFRGSYSGDGVQFPEELKRMCEREMEIFYELSKRNYQKHCGATTTLCFCGDTVYCSTEYINWFNERSQYADLLIFDNDMIRKYVFTNIPSLKNKKSLIGYFETPLLRFIKHNTSLNVKRQLLSLGRSICSFDIKKQIPIHSIPLEKPFATNIFENLFYRIKYQTLANFNGRTRFQLASVTKVGRLKKERNLFFKIYKEYAFGMSHIYNLFDVNVTEVVEQKNLFDYKTANYIECPNFDKPFPQVYALDNNASKDVSYLMMGIIPVIPHINHSFYKDLYEKKMAIWVRSIEDLKKLWSISQQEIQHYRDNIYANRQLFAFETIANKLLDSLHLKQ